MPKLETRKNRDKYKLLLFENILEHVHDVLESMDSGGHLDTQVGVDRSPS